jgi:hypothetical protein
MLTEQTYGAVRWRMEQRPLGFGEQTAAVKITEDNRRMLTTAGMSYDDSFSSQIGTLVNDPESIGLTKPPQAYVTTAHSAVPLADAVRGYYDAIGQPRPPINYIMAKSMVAASYFWGRRCQPNDILGHEMHQHTQKVAAHEVERLTPLLDEHEHVCIIDEYVSSGTTLRFAAELLERAGVEQVSAIRGQWYTQVYEHEIDLERVTSTHADFMYDLGSQV